MFTVETHEYNAEKGIDYFRFGPIGLDAAIKVVPQDGAEPQVLLGVDWCQHGQEQQEPAWSVCPNPEIAKIAIEYYNERNK